VLLERGGAGRTRVSAHGSKTISVHQASAGELTRRAVRRRSASKSNSRPQEALSCGLKGHKASQTLRWNEISVIPCHVRIAMAPVDVRA